MDETIFGNIVRIGKVSSINSNDKTARVIFEDKDLVSGWLHVLQHNGANVSVEPDNSHTHTITDTWTGGGSASTVPNHKHEGTHLTYWMPKINDMVLVLYLPVFNGDGFILGVI